MSDSVHDRDRIFWTYCCTASKSHTSKFASFWSCTWYVHSFDTALNSRILVFVRCFFASSGTLNECDFLYEFSGFNTHDRTDLLSGCCSTNWTAIDWCFSICDCFCKSITTCVSTTTTVISWKFCTDSHFLLVYRNFKFL